MRRNGSTRGNDVIRTCLLTSFLVGSLFAPPISAQTADAYRNRATELAHAKSWDDAITNYRKALELEPNDAATHYNLGLTLKGKGESREALKEFQAALETTAEVGGRALRTGLGLRSDLHDQDEAVRELRTTETLDPANPSARSLVGPYPCAAEQSSRCRARN